VVAGIRMLREWPRRTMRDHAFGCTCEGHVARPWNRPEHWSKAEVEYLERSYGRRADEAIARHLGRTVSGVRLRAKRLGLRKRDIGLSAREVAGLLGVDESAVSKIWIRRGLLRARPGFPIGGGRRQWVIDEPDVETFIREHGHWIDATRVPDDSPFRELAMANRWVSLPEVSERTGHGKKWLLWYFRAGLFPTRRKADRWYMREADVHLLPSREPDAIEDARFRRASALENRRRRRRAAA